MRERGLKQYSMLNLFYIREVAPHAGAWIETSPLESIAITIFVAPHAGAWIETQT